MKTIPEKLTADNPKGRGSAGLVRGGVVLKIDGLKPGDLLIQDSRRFNATNVLEIRALAHWPHAPGEICTAGWLGEPATFSLWNGEFADGEYHRATVNGAAVNLVELEALKRAEAMRTEIQTRQRPPASEPNFKLA